jgi:membrane protein
MAEDQPVRSAVRRVVRWRPPLLDPPKWLPAPLRNGYLLTERTIRDAIDDRLPGLAAELAFFVMLALPPLLLVAFGAIGYVAQQIGPDAVAEIQDQLLEWAGNVLAESTVEDLVRPAVERLIGDPQIEIVSIAMIVALWSASRAIRALMRAMAIAYDIDDHRSWWTRATLALAITVAGVLIAVVILPLLILGPAMGANLVDEYGWADEFAVVWQVLWWPVVIGLGITVLAWVYHIAPPLWTPWRRDLPGAVTALIIWAAGALLLRLYAAQFIEGNTTYGLFAAPLVLLLWFYVASIALLIGAEVNAEVEKMWPTSDVYERPHPDGAETAAGPVTEEEDGGDEPQPVADAAAGPEAD